VIARVIEHSARAGFLTSTRSVTFIHSFIFTALMEGFQRWGKGHWTQIKEEAGDRLDFRTNVNIKDKHRVLERQGKI
jgi:hypothetical protein